VYALQANATHLVEPLYFCSPLVGPIHTLSPARTLVVSPTKHIKQRSYIFILTAHPHPSSTHSIPLPPPFRKSSTSRLHITYSLTPATLRQSSHISDSHNELPHILSHTLLTPPAVTPGYDKQIYTCTFLGVAKIHACMNIYWTKNLKYFLCRFFERA
jgi:hypothetical protein